jgi:hypothetical protein
MDTYAPAMRTRPLYRGIQVVWYIFGIIVALLAIRFLLKLLGANPAAGFSSFIYDITAPLVGPFVAVFGPSRVQGSVLEWTTILAMLVYWLIAWAIVRLLVMSKPVSTLEASHKLSQQDI